MECETNQQIIDDPGAPVSKKMRPCDYAEYDSLVDQLAVRLNIARHPDSSVVIRAARLLIENTLSTERKREDIGVEKEDKKQQSQKQSAKEIRIQQSKFHLNDVSLPVTTFSATESSKTTEVGGDVKKDDLLETFVRASKALKLLYLNDQKQLQNQVNEITSLIQSVTANPKTDSRLLTTGR